MKNLGKKATDKITGFTGIITGKAEYLFCTPQYLITPTTVVNNTTTSGEWFESLRLTIEDNSQDLGLRVIEIFNPEKDDKK